MHDPCVPADRHETRVRTIPRASVHECRPRPVLPVPGTAGSPRARTTVLVPHLIPCGQTGALQAQRVSPGGRHPYRSTAEPVSPIRRSGSTSRPSTVRWAGVQERHLALFPCRVDADRPEQIARSAGGEVQDTTTYSCHWPGTPLRSWAPRSSKEIPEPVTASLAVCETSTSLGPATAPILAPM